MIFEKTKILKFDDYIQIKRPTYLYIKITPHKSTRNYNSNSIAKAIAGTYKAINKRIYKERGKLIIESNFKISYIIDIEKDNTNFYFLVPELFLNAILVKIKEVWSKATVEVMEEGIKGFGDNALCYSLSYKKEDALSLEVDRKSNEPLNSILSIMEDMQENDRVTIIYNFMPNTQANWKEQYQSTMQKITEKKSIDKKVLSFDYILRNGVLGLLGVLDSLMSVVNDFLGGETTGTQESLYTSIMGVLERRDELTIATKKKKESTVINTQILIVGESENTTQAESNIINTCQAYSSIDSDNELTYKKVKKLPKILDYDYNIDKNIFSSAEVGNFLQIPGRLLLNQFGIKHINIEETIVPQILKQGTKRLGSSLYKGNSTEIFLDDDWDFGNCGLVTIGGMGAGKTTFISNNVEDCIEANEGIIVIDFIKNCELSESIAKITPTHKLVKINLAKESDIQSFAYNEMKITDNMTIFKKLDLASMQSDQLMNLIDGVSTGDPLSSGMRRIFNAASTVVSIQGYSSLKNTIECLENHKKRNEYINNLSQLLKDNLEEEINTLAELNELNKTGEIVGTKSTKISFILDRVDSLRSNFKLKYMYKANSENNIDFVKCMDENKVVLIQMRDGDFPTKMQKNILVTYFITKIWLASQIRGMTQLKPSRSNLIIDEIFQAPTAMNVLEYILVQARKFSLKPVLSLHYIRQVEKIFEALLTSNVSFMMLKGCTEDDFNHFKSKLDEQFTYEDLKDMKRYHSLNLICHSEGYSSFITKLPGPI
ncbi:hypothetical protein KPL42_03015 [Clostridium gasigenes]|uniref:hypothetical protein n=1 Tax=Clostridium gasigenes TaxID=94869 RepID=UPI001C0B479A|nr:hypothetical protein [Clostridium gasigenes]MBU3087458.1 hypothetical protein [Clostridium gasigenes]